MSNYRNKKPFLLLKTAENMTIIIGKDHELNVLNIDTKKTG